MNYRLDKYGNKISILGFGCMRFAQSKGKINMGMDCKKERKWCYPSYWILLSRELRHVLPITGCL